MAKAALEFTKITNTSRQMVPIQVKPPAGDFYLHERSVRLGAGKSVVLPSDHLMPSQLENLKARTMISTAAAN